jgi:ubiquinone/menaquinone biosynthesis C-methylase UbiE
MQISRQNSGWGRIALCLLCVLVVFAALNVAGQGINTLDRLTAVERDRDRWQRAAAIIEPLQLRDGSRVVDLGCGAGYFALKLAARVGPKGSVQAVDILRLPLTFLWIRARLNRNRALRVVLGSADDPHIEGSVDAVLIANTYHELARPGIVLGHVRQALSGWGRMVITDRASQGVTGEHSNKAIHASDPAAAQAELERDGFDVVSRDDHFLDQPDEGPWWLIVAQPHLSPVRAQSPL